LGVWAEIFGRFDAQTPAIENPVPISTLLLCSAGCDTAVCPDGIVCLWQIIVFVKERMAKTNTQDHEIIVLVMHTFVC